ncbi:hypothetical protein [Acetobacter sp. P5B1]|uniref:hypothetical protein n=1 Tax=Acetobacter sp. P5B1 TaxID=2762620 RepID=UPI00207B6D24|nr:hypothetical protein [Acetobacter sp. P5B1]
MALTSTEISTIVSASTMVIGLVEKYGAEAWTTIQQAVETSLSSDGPTDQQIADMYAKCVADNQAIQDS